MDNVKMEVYTAKWCGPCRATQPAIDALIAEGWNIEKIDVDQNRTLAQELRIAAVPTYILYKDGVQVNRFSGARTKDFYLQSLKNAAQ